MSEEDKLAEDPQKKHTRELQDQIDKLVSEDKSVQKYYKVLVNGKSCHGGEMTWSLPSDNGPGEWHTVEGKLVLCEKGLHVTTDPNHWWKDGCSIYEVEIDGEIAGKNDEKAKILVPKVRLLTLVKVLKIDGKWQIQQDESRSIGWSDPIKVES